MPFSRLKPSGISQMGCPVPSNQTFQKRQKEMARKERQRAKAERKAQRKLEKQSAQTADSEIATQNEPPSTSFSGERTP